MKAFELATEWVLATRAETVWDVLMDGSTWPQWWPYVHSVEEIERGEPGGLGAVRRYVWTSRLPYRLTFDMRVTRVERPSILEGAASGELQGHGRWTLTERGAQTRVRYDWRVEVTKRWMRALAPCLAPAFRWNHHAVMRAGGEGLARRLGCALVAERAFDGPCRDPLAPTA